MALQQTSAWESFYEIADAATTPDTTLVATAGGFPINTRSANAIDLLKFAGAGKNLNAVWLEFIFSIGHAADGDGKIVRFELYGSNTGGPRQAVGTWDLTGGTAQVVSGADTATWADTIAVATEYRGVDADTAKSFKGVINDSGNNNVASLAVPVLGLRYWEGLFTDGGVAATAVNCIAYYRWYTNAI